MMRRPAKTMIAITICLSMLTTGCASSMTASGPPLTTIEEGETHLSEPVALQYDVSPDPRPSVLRVTQTPVCREMIARESVSRKKLRGVLPAVIEIGFFGLGILDLVVAHAIIQNSEARTPLDAAPTGNTLPCADGQPAAHQSVIFQFSGADVLGYGQTDADGRVEPDAPPSYGDVAYTAVFVRSGTTKKFAGVVWSVPPTP